MKKNKKKFFETIQQKIESRNFTIIDKDWDRPWGGFLVIDEDQAAKFLKAYFQNQSIDDFSTDAKLSPKILMVQSGKRLSWQYHHRRAELWTVLDGPVGVITSDTNEQGPLQRHQKNDTITIDQGERHRLVGLDGWGVVAEIWQHTDSDNASDEDDIVRVQDDYGR